MLNALLLHSCSPYQNSVCYCRGFIFCSESTFYSICALQGPCFTLESQVVQRLRQTLASVTYLCGKNPRKSYRGCENAQVFLSRCASWWGCTLHCEWTAQQL